MLMQVLADENLPTIIMEIVDDPRTLYHLVIALPTAKRNFDRYPRRLLTAVLRALSSELEQLALLDVGLIQHHPTPASKMPIFHDFLRLTGTAGSEVLYVAAADLAISTILSDPFETLRRLADFYEDLANGLVE